MNWGSSKHTLHGKAVDGKEAKEDCRLLAGGQALRGGDRPAGTNVTARNCCVGCLERGRKAAETLERRAVANFEAARRAYVRGFHASHLKVANATVALSEVHESRGGEQRHTALPAAAALRGTASECM